MLFLSYPQNDTSENAVPEYNTTGQQENPEKVPILYVFNKRIHIIHLSGEALENLIVRVKLGLSP
jgi:hypothetical protein